MTRLFNQRASMSDGATLATDVWLPDGPGPWPTVFLRTPYHKSSGSGDAASFTERGYAYVVQDVRGKNDSDGVFAPLEQEQADGIDAIDWVANQRWCSGDIGMYGRSYLGIVQLPAASGGHEALRCLVPGVAPVDFFNDWIRYDGCFALANMIRWPFEHSTVRTKPQLNHIEWPRVWKYAKSATTEELEARLGAPLTLTRKWLAHDTLDDYWRSLDQRRLYPSVRCPALHLAGFFDHLSRGQFSTFAGLREQGATEAARTGQRLVVGPWGHSSQTKQDYGEWDFGPQSALVFRDYALRFFDLHLKRIDDGISEEPPIRYYLMGENLMGENRWDRADAWPPADAERISWHLDSDGTAVGLGSSGRLERDAPTGGTPDGFTYDPADPVPTHGGQVYWAMSEMSTVGPADQRGLLARGDVLLYRSAPLAAPVTVVGDIDLELWVSSTAEDTDFIAKLCVVDPVGRIDVLTLGSLRAKYRESRSEPKPLPRGTAVKLDIQMNHLAYTFPTGSRIALTVTSSCFPRILPHPNRFEPAALGTVGEPATQRVHHDREHRSRLILPVIGRG